MQRLLIKTLFAEGEKYADQTVTVCGWARTIRDSKVFGFIELNDGSCFKSLQIVFEQGTIDNFEEIAKLNVGSALVVTGKVVLTFAPVQTLFPQQCVYVAKRLLHCTAFSTAATSCTCTRRLSRLATARAQAKCSA